MKDVYWHCGRGKSSGAGKSARCVGYQGERPRWIGRLRTWSLTSPAAMSCEASDRKALVSQSPHDRSQPPRPPAKSAPCSSEMACLTSPSSTPWAARRPGFSENVGHVARVFAYHWPNALPLGDITIIGWNEIPPVDVLGGGYPCQDVVVAGRGHRRRWDATPTPSPNGARAHHPKVGSGPALLSNANGPRPARGFVEWLMSLPGG